MRLVFRRLARTDIESAFEWYMEQDPRLGGEFLAEVDQVVERVAAYPQQFPDVHRGVRRGLLRRFPYAVFFRSEGDTVTVMAVVHQKRSPGLWKRRT